MRDTAYIPVHVNHEDRRRPWRTVAAFAAVAIIAFSIPSFMQKPAGSAPPPAAPVVGPSGAEGMPGLPGRDGIDGADGIGIQGPAGPRGVPGPAGESITGPAGPPGPSGAPGVTVCPAGNHWQSATFTLEGGGTLTALVCVAD